MRALALLLGLLAAPPVQTRVADVLVLNIPAYHGSTAVEQLLMSSDNVTTVCSMGCWQCEAHFYRHNKSDGRWSDAHCKEPNPTNKQFATALSDWSNYWNLTRPVLLLKYGGGQDPGKKIILTGSQDFIKEASSQLPAPMLDAGVTSLRLSIVQVWRPLCLANLSSHFIRMVNEEGEHAAVEFDANWIEKGVYAHRAFREAGVNVLLLSYADLLWRPDVVLQRLRSFLPGELLHGVHFDFEPKLGRDIFPGNHLKVHGSLTSFGKEHPPISLDYDLKRSMCKCSASTDVLNMSYFKAERYLAYWSA